MRTRILAGLLSLCLLAGWLPTAALADEAEGVPPSGVTCNQEETCQAAEHLEGCPRYAVPAEDVPDDAVGPEQPEPLSEEDAVAQVGIVYYATLQDAFDDAADGECVTLTRDITDMATSDIATVAAGKTLTLDMSGKRITVASDFVGRPIVNEGTLTVTGNGTIDASASAEGGYGAINNKGTLTIEDGTYRGAKYASGSGIRNTGSDAVLTVQGGTFDTATCAIFNEGTATINGGDFSNTSCSTCAANDGHSGVWSYTIRNYSQDSCMVINDGYFKGTQGAVSASIGYLEVNGGTFETVVCDNNHTSSVFYALYAAGEAGTVQCIIHDGTFKTAGNYTAVLIGNDNTNGDGGINADACSYIYGGTFLAPEGVSAVKVSPNTANSSVLYGGSYSMLGETDALPYVAAECRTVEATEGGVSYVVQARTEEDTDAVAKVGDKVYASLQTAIDAAEGGTAVLLKDTAESITVSGDRTVTLDLGGNTLTNTAGSHTITVVLGGRLTLEDSAGNGKVDNISHAKAALFNNGTAVLNGGEYTRSAENGQNAENNGGNSYYNLVNHGVMTIGEGVSVSQSGRYSSMVENGYQNYGTEYKEGVNSAAPTLTITGGLFDGGLNTIKNDDGGVLDISGGTFKNVTQYALMNWNEASISGGTFTSDTYAVVNCGSSASTNDVGKLTITGGTFAGTAGSVAKAAGADDPVISGGTFSSDVSAYVITGSTAEKVQDESGMWHIVPAANSVAAIGSLGYETLKDAIDAAQQGDTILLLKDVSDAVGISVPSGKAFTIDFDGHIYTLTGPGADSTNTETNGFQLLKDSTLVFQNGTIAIAENANNIKRIIQNYADLTLENMTIKAKNQVDGEDYTLSFNNGAIVFKGNTSVVTSSDEVIAFDICQYASYPGVTVTFDEDYTGTITGKILYDSTRTEDTLTIHGQGTFGGIIADERAAETAKSAISVSGGTFGSALLPEYCAEGFAPTQNSDGTYSVAKPTIALDSTASVHKGYTTSLAATLDPANAEVTMVWTSSNESIATVDGSGVVTGVAEGAAEITVQISLSGVVLDSAVCTVTVTASSSSGGSGGGSSTYAVSVESTSNGTVAVSPRNASRGDTVTVKVKPDSGYELDALAVTDKNGGTVELTKKSDTQYTFTMPGSKVSVTASFIETLLPDETPSFTDVSSSDYYYDAVAWAVGEGITTGTSAATFSPDVSCTRAQMVTFLWRAAGSPAPVRSDTPFLDVRSDAYYFDAVLWAVEQGVTTGTSATTFSPEVTVTRSQTVTLLYRFAGSPTVGSSIPFTDVEAGAYYASAVQWAVEQGITTGTSATTFQPLADCTRAQIVTFLYRCLAG